VLLSFISSGFELHRPVNACNLPGKERTSVDEFIREAVADDSLCTFELGIITANA